MSNETTCKGCGEPLRFIRTIRGKSMPVDPEPQKVLVAENNYFAVKDGYTPHWQSCPAADQFRKGD